MQSHIREALEKIENKHNQQQAMLHKLEILRDELVAKGDAALTDLLNEHSFCGSPTIT